MIIKLLGRFTKDSTDHIASEIEQELDTQELIQGDAFNRAQERQRLIQRYKAYDYVPIVFNLKDVALYNAVDAQHTSIKLYYNLSYTFRITLDQFTAVYQTFLGTTIKDYTQWPVNDLYLPYTNNINNNSI